VNVSSDRLTWVVPDKIQRAEWYMSVTLAELEGHFCCYDSQTVSLVSSTTVTLSFVCLLATEIYRLCHLFVFLIILFLGVII